MLKLQIDIHFAETLRDKSWHEHGLFVRCRVATPTLYNEPSEAINNRVVSHIQTQVALLAEISERVRQAVAGYTYRVNGDDGTVQVLAAPEGSSFKPSHASSVE